MYKLIACISVLLLASAGCEVRLPEYQGLDDDFVTSKTDTILSEKIIYHNVRVNQEGAILPWPSANLGQSYDQVIKLVWNFWKNIEIDSGGIPYYMYHQVWSQGHDRRGLGGDQLQMALSSWDLLYNYTGDESIKENMKFMADFYLSHSLSPADCKWPDLPYPYNMDIHSGHYDGDMILGEGFTQPDKAGSLGIELVKLYKKTGDEKYLDAAVKIANTLAYHVQPGDNENSPWPFKVHAETGKPGIIVDDVQWYEGMPGDLKKSDQTYKSSSYTTNWSGALKLFADLVSLQSGQIEAYRKAFNMTLDWMKKFPAKTNKWGPFFEDVPRWSDTQINAVTYAMYIMDNPELDPDWEATVKSIFEWVHNELDDDRYFKYGVITIDEQTAYRQPGNSHCSRQASMALKYWELTGDTSFVRNAILMLNWATYMVDSDGKNFYPTNAVWMTDGYGDYVRHYLRAMAAAPQLAPDNSDHMLRSTSVVSKISYSPSEIIYQTFDDAAEELFRLTSKPRYVNVNNNRLDQVSNMSLEGWTWQTLDNGGILKIKRSGGNNIVIVK
jgi:hypothetical protein